MRYITGDHPIWTGHGPIGGDDWLFSTPLARTAFFRNDFTTGRHVEGGRVVSWPGGWTVQRDSTAYYTTASGALIAAADDVARVAHFDADEMVRALLMEAEVTNLVASPTDLFTAPWFTANMTRSYDSHLDRLGNPMTVITNSGGPSPQLGQNLDPSVVGSGPITISVDVRTDLNRYVKMYGFGNGSSGVAFDLQAMTSQVNGAWESASIRSVGANVARITGTLTPNASETLYIGPASGVEGDWDNTVGVQLSLSLAMAVYGTAEPSFTTDTRDADKVYRTDLVALGVDSSGFSLEVKGAFLASGSFDRVAQAGESLDRSALQIHEDDGAIYSKQFAGGVAQQSIGFPYIEGSVAHILATYGSGSGAGSLVVDGVLAGAADPGSFVPPGSLYALAEDASGVRKPANGRIQIIGAHPAMTPAQAIDASKVVSTVAQIEGVTPLLDLDFENRAFSMGGKARGLSNILAHARDGAAYGLLSDGRMASHPDDFPRLTFEGGARAHLGEAETTNLLPNSANPGGWSGGGTITTAQGDGQFELNELVRWTRTSAGSQYRALVNGYPKAAQALPYACEFEYKEATSGYFAVRVQGQYPARVDVVVDLSDHSPHIVQETGFSIVGAVEIEALPQGTRRLRFKLLSNADTAMTVYASFNDTGQGVDSTSGNTVGNDGLIGHTQILPGETYSSPIRTSGGAASRAADLSSVDLAPLAGQLDDGFCLLWDALFTPREHLDRVLRIDDGSADNRIDVFWSEASNQLRATTFSEGVYYGQPGFAAAELSGRFVVRVVPGLVELFGPGGPAGSQSGYDLATGLSQLLLGASTKAGINGAARLLTKRAAIVPSSFTAAQAQAWIGAVA